MTPAKVTTSKGRVFFVPDGEEITEKGREQDLPEGALNDLVKISVHGTRNGFKTVDEVREINKEFYTEVGVRRRSARGPVERNKFPFLELRDGTRIEPVTQESMEWYQKRIERK